MVLHLLPASGNTGPPYGAAGDSVSHYRVEFGAQLAQGSELGYELVA